MFSMNLSIAVCMVGSIFANLEAKSAFYVVVTPESVPNRPPQLYATD